MKKNILLLSLAIFTSCFSYKVEEKLEHEATICSGFQREGIEKEISLLEAFMNGNFLAEKDKIIFCHYSDDEKKYEETLEDCYQFLKGLYNSLRGLAMEQQSTPLIQEYTIANFTGDINQQILALTHLIKTPQGILELQMKRYDAFMNHAVSENKKSEMLEDLERLKSNEKRYNEIVGNKSSEDFVDAVIKRELKRMELRVAFEKKDADLINCACAQLRECLPFSLKSFLTEPYQELEDLQKLKHQ